MKRVRNPIQGDQLSLPMERSQTWEHPNFVMREIAPPQIVQFLKSRGGRDVEMWGHAIAHNSQYTRVRFTENGERCESDIPHARILSPLEHRSIFITAGAAQAETLHTAIADLETERRNLEAEEIAPHGCWLEVPRCNGRKCKQVFYRSTQPIFGGKKRKYVGMENSAGHKNALTYSPG